MVCCGVISSRQQKDGEGVSNQYATTGGAANTLRESVTSREEAQDAATRPAQLGAVLNL
jgi:hypothetical protein